MGVDLTLYPIQAYEDYPPDGWVIATTRIDLRRHRAFKVIRELPQTPWPTRPTFRLQSDTTGISEPWCCDGQGIPLCYVLAGVLGAVEALAVDSVWNAAVLAFVRALPADTRIVLYWH